METVFSLLGAPVTAYGLHIALAMLMVWVGAGLYATRMGMDRHLRVPFGLWLLPITWFVSRLVYILANITYYTTTLSNPWLALLFWDGGYSAAGAAIGILLAAWGFAKVQRVQPGILLDAAALSMLPAIAIIRMAEAGTDLGLGKTVAADWMRQLSFFAVEDATGELVHAVYRYEALTAVILFLVAIRWLARGSKNHHQPGDLAMVVMTVLGLTQVFWESLRDDGHMVVHFVRISQALSVLAPLWVLAALRKRKSPFYPLRWVIFLVGVGNTIYQEFLIDSSEHPALNYTFMLLSLVAMGWAILSCFRHGQETVRKHQSAAV